MPAVVNTKTPAQEKDEWRTDPTLFALLDAEFDFQLDVAATHQNNLGSWYYTQEENALNRRWVIPENKIHRVFCNPPFSQVDKFLLKGRKEAANGATCVFLVRADGIETRWWKEGVLVRSMTGETYLPACEIRFLSPRTNYLRPDGSKATGVTFPSAVIVMGPGVIPIVYWWNWKEAAVRLLK